MAHEILGNRFISRVQSAWHNIARRIFKEDEVISAREAMAEVAGDVTVYKAPLNVLIDQHVDGKGQWEPSGYSAIVRAPVPEDRKSKVLGVTKDAWVAATYADLAASLDELSAKYKVETAGVLKEGGLAFLCFRGEDYDVRKDAMRTYFAANFSLTPGIGHRILHSPVRVVCWNTNLASEAQATINLSVPHSVDALQRMQLASKLIAQFAQTQERTKAIFEAFADRHISGAEAEAIFAAAYPVPPMPAKVRLLKEKLTAEEATVFKASLDARLLQTLVDADEQHERDKQRQAALRDAAAAQFESFDPAHLRGTAWAAYNAVTEVADWRNGRGADESAVIGSRAREKGRAFEAAMELIEVQR